MGMNNDAIGLGEVLFSKTRRQVFRLLFGQPDSAYHLNEIVRLAGVGIGSVSRELEKLTTAGLINAEKVGNQKHYRANQDSPIYAEIRGIVLKTFGLADVVRAALAGLSKQIGLAFVYGSVAKGNDTASSDIDLLVIAEGLSYADLVTALAVAEQQLGRAINPTVYTPEEVRRKLDEGNAFVQRVLEQPKLILLGDKDDIPAVGEPGAHRRAKA